MWKACSRCGKIHDSRYKCNVGRVYNGGIERELRQKSKWHYKSRDIREKSFYLCEVCRDKGIFNNKDIEVHHIVKIKDDKDSLLDDSNLVALCQSHHKEADAGKIDPDYLRELARKRDSGRSPMGLEG